MPYILILRYPAVGIATIVNGYYYSVFLDATAYVPVVLRIPMLDLPVGFG
jgi:hypothetical protein